MHRLEGAALIADDDEFFRIALRAIMKSELRFAEVVETASLDEAVERLSDRDDVSLALFDLSMPGMESPASLRAVRDCFPDLRIAVVSGSSRRRDILSALQAGVHGYVPKLLGVAELARAIQLIIDGVIYVPPSIADLPSASEEQEDLKAVSTTAQKSVNATVTPRQRQVLELLVQGKANKEIARALQLGEGTVKVHMAALFRTLDVSTRAAAAVAGSQLLSHIKAA